MPEATIVFIYRSLFVMAVRINEKKHADNINIICIQSEIFIKLVK